jgi:hypothetical protein
VDNNADETTDKIPDPGMSQSPLASSPFHFHINNPFPQLLLSNHIRILIYVPVSTRKVDERHFYYKYTLKVKDQFIYFLYLFIYYI